MKNAILGALTALIMLTGTASAQGNVLKFESLQWRFPSSTGAMNKYVDRKVIANGVSDTTTWISTEGWSIPVGGYGVAVGDSLALARIVVYVDSAYTVPSGSFTVKVQGAMSGDNNLAFTLADITVTPTSGQKYFEVPVYLKHTSVAGVHPSGWGRIAPLVRIVVANGGTAWNACRVGVVYLGSQ